MLLEWDTFSTAYRALSDQARGQCPDLATEYDFDAELTKFKKRADDYRSMIVDGVYWINDAYRKGNRILAEGANAAMLDLDFGTYPFVTSSSTTAGGLCTGLGLSPDKIDCTLGVVKAYTTRVGWGPFPCVFFVFLCSFFFHLSSLLMFISSSSSFVQD